MSNLPRPTDPVGVAQALIRCESVTPVEGGALDLLERLLVPLGFTIRRLRFSEPGTPDVDNLYARVGSTGRNLCFAGHTDVVPPGDVEAWTSPPFAALIHDGVLYGRGAVDMKGSIACFVAAVAQLLADDELPDHASISLLITGDEEGPSINGTAKMLAWLADNGERLDACLVGEPSNPHRVGDEIKIGRRGSRNGEIVVSGRQGHAAYPAKADNPVPKLARLIDRLSNLSLDQGTENFEPSNLQVTLISVPNTAANVIPGEARATFNVRYNTCWTADRLEAHLRAALDTAAADVGAHYRMSFSGTGDVFLTEPGPLVATITGAVEAETGQRPRLSTGGGTSDARFIKDYCPVVEFGLVNETIHRVDEHVPLADLAVLTGIYRRFITGYFAAAG
ncbi:MAG: succinyl-diaminopimelate desuccinylase [Hyphomicrobiaceae bacterium]|nr:succinyl-diaminopimelate desuccinylase [Hyphomicrobiaceae bacterium]